MSSLTRNELLAGLTPGEHAIVAHVLEQMEAATAVVEQLTEALQLLNRLDDLRVKQLDTLERKVDALAGIAYGARTLSTAADVLGYGADLEPQSLRAEPVCARCGLPCPAEELMLSEGLGYHRLCYQATVRELRAAAAGQVARSCGAFKPDDRPHPLPIYCTREAGHDGPHEARALGVAWPQAEGGGDGA